MIKLNNFILLILQIIFFSIIFNQVQSKNLEKYSSKNISAYFSGIVSLYDNEYMDSYKFLKKLNGLENKHYNYAQLYQYSLINLGKFQEAFKYAKKLENKGIENFENNLIIGVHYLKNKKYNLAKKYFKKIYKNKDISSLQVLISQSLFNWASYENIDSEEAKKMLNLIPPQYDSIKKIQNSFLHCYYSLEKTSKTFEQLLNNKKQNYARYSFFFANYLERNGKRNQANEVIAESLMLHPRNLMLNQMKNNFYQVKNKDRKNLFNCKNAGNVGAELLYIAANALSTQSIYSVSNFYINLAKYLNPNFASYNTLHAENFFMSGDYEKAKKMYIDIQEYGSAFKWYASKQIASILYNQNKKDNSYKFLQKIFKDIDHPSIYEIYDYAEFLKENEKFKESIKYYSDLMKLIKQNHPLYPKVTDSRGIAYERIGNWDEAEKDLIRSLSVKPNQPYVINYLAYSWIEKGIKINESLEMLKKANDLKANDGYIIDSLGWALFKLKKYKQSKKYLQQAVKIMPSDPVVNNHFGDSLWMNGKKIQARYYWKYVLNLKKTDDKLKSEIIEKLIFGPKSKT
jgi:tetratricopeptide (TPR) repeat protein